jgi:RimJ/RimL family protein N-acetyltransferase
MFATRSSSLKDAEAIARCVDAVARERRYLAQVHGFSTEDTRDFIASLEERGGVQLVALEGGNIIGWCDVSPVPNEGMRHVGRLGMGVLHAYRGQGVGRQLLIGVLAQSFSRGFRRIECEVYASNKAAIELYARQGFELEGRKRQARVLDGKTEDILIMGLLREDWTGPAS